MLQAAVGLGARQREATRVRGSTARRGNAAAGHDGNNPVRIVFGIMMGPANMHFPPALGLAAYLELDVVIVRSHRSACKVSKCVRDIGEERPIGICLDHALESVCELDDFRFHSSRSDINQSFHRF